MNVRRFEHLTKNRFWEVYWDGAVAEVMSGALGSAGRAREIGIEDVEREIAKRLREGYEEVVPDRVKDQAAPTATPPPALMQRILEAPDDDQPRAVLADWLQQQGDPLGELIAVQLELARAPTKRLRDRETHLLATFRPRWLGGEVADVTFVRGFADTLKVEMPPDAEALARIIAVSPLLQTLVVPAPSTYYTRWPWELMPGLLRAFSGIFITGHRPADDAQIAAFAALDLPKLDRLGLRSMGLLPSSWKRLAARTWRALDLHHNSLGRRGVEYLAAHDRRALASLDLGSNEIGDEGVKLLAAIPLPALRVLSLKRSLLTPACLPHLARFGHLQTLDISHNNLDEAYVREVLPGVKLTGKKAR